MPSHCSRLVRRKALSSVHRRGPGGADCSQQQAPALQLHRDAAKSEFPARPHTFLGVPAHSPPPPEKGTCTGAYTGHSGQGFTQSPAWSATALG